MEEEMNGTTTQRVSQEGTCSLGGLVLVYTSEYFVSDVIACMVNVILTLSTLLLNSVMIIAYCKSSLLKKSLSNFLITILSCVDFALGGIVNSMFAVFLLTKVTGNGSCKTVLVIARFYIVLSSMSVAILTSMNIERYLAVLHPFIYLTKLTRRRLLMLTAFLWSGYIAALYVSFLKPGTFLKMLFAFMICFAIFTVWIYVKIFLSKRKSLQGINLNIELANNSTASLRVSVNRKTLFLKELKSSKSCFFAIISSLITSVPQLIISGMVNDGIPLRNKDIYVTWTITIVMFSYSLNSVIFFWLNTRLKNESINIVKNAFSKK